MLSVLMGIAVVWFGSNVAVPLKSVDLPGGEAIGDPTGPGQASACCLPDGTCAELPRLDCLAQGGTPRRMRDCSNVDCSNAIRGACCVGHMPGTRACVEIRHEICDAIGGVYQGDGTDCQNDPTDPSPCTASGLACCLPGGSCEELGFIMCMLQGGQPNPGATCELIDCGVGSDAGACCLNGGGMFGCVVLQQTACDQLGGEYQGNGTDCNGGPMNPPCGDSPTHACCLPDGSCLELPVSDCLQSGGQPNPDGSCMNAGCDEEGACCLHLAGQPGCVIASPAGCAHLAGTFQGNGTTCEGNPMDPSPCDSPVVPCCLPAPLPEGICVELPIQDCFAQGGQPHQAPSCEQVQCSGGPAHGACCVQGGGNIGCIMATAELCMQLGGEYHGDGTDCFGDPMNPPPCPPPPSACCLPDGSCQVMFRDDCLLSGGTPHNVLSCENVDCNGGPHHGACCANLPGIPPCVVVSPEQCAQFGGTYQGDGTDCQGNPMDPPCDSPIIPCCIPSPFPEGICVEVPLNQCLAMGGQPHQAPSCEQVQCVGGPSHGACCLNGNGMIGCIVLTPDQCAQFNGEYQGDGTSCGNNPMDPPPCDEPTRACCLPNGVCQELTILDCIEAGGEPLPSAFCENTDCNGGPHNGACCINLPGIPPCIVTSPEQCAQFGGAYQGDGTDCQGNPMDPPCDSPVVPCCIPAPLPEGICVEIPLNQCLAQGGQPQMAPSCEDALCSGGPGIGACCLNGGGVFGCIVLPANHCMKFGGEYQGDGTDCFGGPNEPPTCGSLPPSACCLPDGSCQVLERDACFMAGGVPQNVTSCEGVDCSAGPGQGACCVHLPGVFPCIVTTEGECQMQFQGEYQGDGTNCMGDPTNPPCGDGGPLLACCLPDGSCQEMRLNICLISGGMPHNAPSCEGVNCGGGPLLACCFPNGFCEVMRPDICVLSGGMPHNVPSCLGVMCGGGSNAGACCIHDPAIPGCIVVTADECAQLMGEYQGDGSDCVGNPMDPPPCGLPIVPCCLPNTGACVEISYDACVSQGGAPAQAPSCDLVDCDGVLFIGACCINVPGVIGCVMVSQSECELQWGGEYQGDNTSCGDPMNPPPCGEQTFACCLPDGNCAELSLQACFAAMGSPQNSLGCMGVMCEGGGAVGACCLNAPGIFGCAILSQADCKASGGEYQGDGTNCGNSPMDPPPCEQPPTACCLPDGSCEVIERDHCLMQGGMPRPDLMCANTTCQNGGGVGACCLNGGPFLTCIMVDAMHCAAIGGNFQGAGTQCPNDPNDPGCP